METLSHSTPGLSKTLSISNLSRPWQTSRPSLKRRTRDSATKPTGLSSAAATQALCQLGLNLSIQTTPLDHGPAQVSSIPSRISGLMTSICSSRPMHQALTAQVLSRELKELLTSSLKQRLASNRFPNSSVSRYHLTTETFPTISPTSLPVTSSMEQELLCAKHSQQVQALMMNSCRRLWTWQLLTE